MKNMICLGFVFILLATSTMPISTGRAAVSDEDIFLDQLENRTLTTAQIKYYEQKITAPDPDELDEFGISVAMSGDTAVIGADKDDVGTHPIQGSAYVFVHTGNTWTFQRKLTASDGDTEDGFGYSVAIDGDTVVVGAPYDDVNGVVDQGSAYVFIRNEGSWTQQGKLNHPIGAIGDNFGFSVAIQNDFVVVGAPYYDYNANQNQGAAFVFDRSGSDWYYLSRLININGKANDMTGFSVGLDGNWFLVGAPNYDSESIINLGAVYVFYYDWGFYFDEILVDEVGESGNYFGSSLAIKNDRALVGAPLALAAQGYVCSFQLQEYDWYQTVTLVALEGAAGDRFGTSVAINRSVAVVGAIGYRQGISDFEGAAYIYKPAEDGWSEKANISASDGEAYSLFGSSVAVSDGGFLIGVYGDDIGFIANQGSAYYYSSSETFMPLMFR